ncbi:MAG: hypothetical protein A3F16_04940 [Deltaproteobacteria bacterium RIFCSPHIGHO2_12_FULL_43_9]|nr:MAG: hypothetical protein A3F16_04940 [Deltaproteobacteria bacterium RIFCSPHIGHO2_12_FULL_43_9]
MRDSTNLPPHKEPPFHKIFFISLAGHVIVLFIAFGLPYFTFREEKPRFPTVRVELVGLPDLRPFEQKEQKTVLKEEKKEKEVVLKPKNEEVILKSTKQKREEDKRLREVVAKEELSDAISEIAKLNREEREIEASLNKGNIKSNEEDNIDPYKLYLNETIYNNWTPPIRGKTGEIPRFQMFIGGNGNILRVVMVKTSGSIEYDKSAESAIRKSSPFSLPPHGLQNELEKDGVIIDFIPPRE